MLQRQESQKRRQNRFLVHHQEIHQQAHAEHMSPPFLTQDSSDFCSDYSQNANWSGILKQGTWMQMSNEACAIKLVMKVYAHQVEYSPQCQVQSVGKNPLKRVDLW